MGLECMFTTPNKALQKSFPFEASAIDDSLGTFTGYASTWTVDDKGDRVTPGAFKRTLAKAEEKRAAENREFLFALTWGHDPNEPIGAIFEAHEDSRGLFIRGLIDLTTKQGKRAYSGLKKGYADGLSVYAIVHKSSYEGAIRRLDELDLVAVGVGAFPTNRDARATDVKSARDAWLESLTNDMATVASRRGVIEKEQDKMTSKRIHVYEENVFDSRREPLPAPADFEDVEAFEKSLKKLLREDDPVLGLLEPGSKAYLNEIELRRRQREQKRAEQQAALEKDRAERAERHAAQSAPSFNPKSFAAAYRLDEPFVRGRFNAWVSAGLVTPIDEKTLTLDANDIRRQYKREHGRFEARFLEMAARRERAA